MPEVTDPSLIAQLELPQSAINRVDDGSPKDPNNSQGVALGFYSRAKTALDLYGDGVAPRGAVTQAIVDHLPTGLVREHTSDARKNADTAAAEFIAATLRKESGAAISPSEYESQFSRYFPVPGDDDQQIKLKKALREQALESIRIQAGDAAPPAPLSFEDQLKAALEDPTKSPADRLKAANAVAQTHGRPIDQKEAVAAAAAGHVDNFKNDPSLLQQAGSSLLNVATGVGEGAVALPDLMAKGAGQVMALPADALGFENVADQLRNPPQVGDMIRSAVPVPQDWNGWSVRQAARLEGGILGFPARAGNALAEAVVGKVPPSPPGNALAGVNNGQLASDANALGIEPTMAAAGGPVSRMATAATAQTIGGARPIVQGAQRMVAQGKNALASIAGREGEPLSAEAMGETATRGALTARMATRNAASAVYDDAIKIAGDARVTPEKGLTELDRNIAELGEVPGGAEGLNYLQGLRDELVQKFPDGITVAGVRGMRTQLRQRFFKEGLRGSDIERRVNGVVDQISDDLANSLAQQGKEQAANLFRQGDKMWAERADLLDNVIMPIIGKKGEKSGEQVAAALKAATEGNGNRFSRFVTALPKEDAGDVRATLINAIGKAKPGVQDAEGDLFSYGTFLTNWTKVSDSARKALFSEGDRGAMDKLARVASRVKDASRYANSSNTGSTLLTGATGAALFANPVAAAPFVGGSYLLGRVLASPGGAQLLMKLSSAETPVATREAFKGFAGLAARNPAAANDILDAQSHLMNALGQTAPTSGRLAASPNEGPSQ